MKKNQILIGLGMVLIGGGVAYYFLSKKKDQQPTDLGIDNSVRVNGGTITGVTMNKPPISTITTPKRISLPIQSAAGFPQTKRNITPKTDD